MTDLSPTSLHPSLQQLNATHRRLTRSLSLLFFLIMAGALVFMMTTALSNRSMENLLIFAVAGLVILPMIALMWGLLWYLERWMTRRLNDANRLLRSCNPVNARLTPAGVSNKSGALMTVQILDRHPATGLLYALIEPNTGWTRPPRQEITAQFYCQDWQPDGRLVALHEGRALLGKLVDGKKYYRQMKWVAIAAVTALLVVATFLAALAFQEYQTYQNLQQQQQWAEASANWSEASGRIIRAELATAKIPKGKIKVDGYWPRIEFGYSVAGVEQQSATPFFCNRPTTHRKAVETWLGEYPAGAAVTVYYDPADSTRGVLKEGYTAACQVALEEKRWDVIFGAGIAGFLFLLMIAVAIVLRRQYCQVQAFLE